MFQIASSNKRTFYIFLFTITKCQVASFNKRTILQLLYSFLISVTPECLVKRCHQKVLSSSTVVRTNTIVDNHVPQWNYITPKRSRIPFSSTNLGIPLLFLVPIKSSFSSCIHNCITNIHSILGQKWCTLYLSLFDQTNQRFHLQISRRRNLNRGICHTPFFDPRWHWHVSDGAE